jgi:hypothetical protein
LFSLDADDIAEMTGPITAGITDLIKIGGEVQIPIPRIVDKIKKAFGSLKGFLETNIAQELIGGIAAVLVAKVLKFETTAMGVGYHGFDVIMWDPCFGRYVVMEAKGGSSTLNKATGQMYDAWIEKRWDKIFNEYSIRPEEKQRLLAEKGKPMWAVVIKLDIRESARKKELGIKIQTYDPDAIGKHSIKPWGPPFE